MITNSTSIGMGGTGEPGPRPARLAGPPAGPRVQGDHVSTARADHLREAIARSPASRPEEIARAEALALDPNYPPLQIIERVARLIADSQDLSEIPD